MHWTAKMLRGYYFMSYRFMRIVVFFDLPTITPENRRDYRNFRKFLIKSGFYMMQESVYCRMVHNQSVEKSVIENIRKNKPSKGLVQVLSITEKQFSKMEFITGEKKTDILDSDERLVVL